MQTSNQTLGAMLAKPPSTGNQSDVGASAVSDYNNRDNSFNNVLEQQRNRRSQAQRQDGPAEQKKPPARSGASQEQQQSAADETTRGGSEAAATGNALPAAEETTTEPLETVELSGELLTDLAAGESLPADKAATEEAAATDGQDEIGIAGQSDNQVGGALIAGQKPGPEQLLVNGEAGNSQRVAAAPAGILNQQREARDAAAALPRAIADQASSAGNDNSSLQETQAFKDALQQLRAANTAPAATPALANADAAGNIEQASQGPVRVDQLLNSVQAATAKPEVAMSTIKVPVSSPNWGQAVAQRVLWLASNGVQAAELQLHPRELGPVEIRISVANDQTQVQFSSQYGVVRESLEASMQRLRELFDASGLQLLDVNVSDQSLAEQQQSAEREADAEAGKSGAVEETAPLVNVAAEQISGAGLVDYYA